MLKRFHFSVFMKFSIPNNVIVHTNKQLHIHMDISVLTIFLMIDLSHGLIMTLKIKIRKKI